MVEEVGELELGDEQPKGNLWEFGDCEDDHEKGALAVLI